MEWEGGAVSERVEKGSAVWQQGGGAGRRAGAPLPRQHPTPLPVSTQPASTPTRWTDRSGCPGCRCCRRSTCGAGRAAGAGLGEGMVGDGLAGVALAAVRFKQVPALPTHTHTHTHCPASPALVGVGVAGVVAGACREGVRRWHGGGGECWLVGHRCKLQQCCPAHPIGKTHPAQPQLHTLPPLTVVHGADDDGGAWVLAHPGAVERVAVAVGDHGARVAPHLVAPPAAYGWGEGEGG